MQVKSPREHSAIHLTFVKLPFVFKTFVLSIFEWPLKKGFTVYQNMHTQLSSDAHYLFICAFISILCINTVEVFASLYLCAGLRASTG